MSHRRESGAVPPWVIPEPKVIEPPCDNKQVDVQKAKIPDSQNNHANYAWGDVIDEEKENVKGQYLHLIGGEIVNYDCIQRANMLIKDGKISAIGKKLTVPKGTPTIDASGYLLLPGGVDISTYILGECNTINSKEYAKCTQSALFGGTTTIVDTILCPKGQLPIEFFVRQKQRMENGKYWCNLVYRIGFMELNDAIIEQFENLVKKHHVTTFLFIVSCMENSKSFIEVGSQELKRALQRCRQLGIVPVLKGLKSALEKTAKIPQNSYDQPTLKRVFALAQETGCPMLLVSPGTGQEFEAIGKTKNRLPPVHLYTTCEPSLFIADKSLESAQKNTMLNYLACGDVTAISSEQIGFESQSEHGEADDVGRRLVTLWDESVPSGWLDATGFVQLTSAAPARMLGLYPQKGRLSPDSDADIVLWPCASAQQTGLAKPAMVLLKGRVTARNGKLVDDEMELGPFITVDGNPLEKIKSEPSGEIINNETFPTAVYSVVHAADRLRKHYEWQREDESWNLKAMNSALPSHQTDKFDSKIETQTTKAETTTAPVNQESFCVRMVHGHRDLHASGFSLSGAQVDDKEPHRSGIRTRQPPGGESRNPLW